MPQVASLFRAETGQQLEWIATILLFLHFGNYNTIIIWCKEVNEGKSKNLDYKTPFVLRFFSCLFSFFSCIVFYCTPYALHFVFQPLKTFFRFSIYSCQQYYQTYNCFAFFKNKKKNIVFFKQNNWVSKSWFEAWLIIIKKYTSEISLE